ncbi:hypothetical protein [Calycomorphotria hydatis]|uniref:NHL repeat protein n=1 Tax=Calycomorphotria hydatis TaxID=2528027 RepID=A0A517T8L6_9PLAN|nr:hypothetical protein [Calycomorphotria hydatis]QDT64688.1 NHL repeat protein [Calycomorphotria hydatis]
MIHRHSILALALSYAIAISASPLYSAEPDAHDSRSILISADRLNGSFENSDTSAAPWSPRYRYRVTDMATKISANQEGSQPTQHGKHSFTISSVNDQGHRGSAGIRLTIPKSDLVSALNARASANHADTNREQLLRLTFSARTRKDQPYGAAIAKVILNKSKTSGERASVFHIREKPPTDSWETFTLEAPFAEELLKNVTEAYVIVGFDGLDGLTSSRGTGDLDNIRLEFVPVPVTEESRLADALAIAKRKAGLSDKIAVDTPMPTAPIPVRFHLDQPGYVTLVIEDETGHRVRNLISAQWFEAGDHTHFWDGLDEGRTLYKHRIPAYEIQRSVASAGTYTVRGLVRDKIGLTYEFTIQPNVKGIPWITDTGNREGGWIGDHGSPTATLFLPKERAPGGNDQMLLASTVNESGHALAWVDLKGNKLAGQKTLGGHWTGASNLAYDHGSRANKSIYAYSRMDWSDGIRLTGLSESGDVKVALHKSREGDGGNPGDIAVHDGLLVMSVYNPDQLVFYDVSNSSPTRQGKQLGAVDLSKPHSVTFDRLGRLLVVSGDKLLRYSLGSTPLDLPSPEVLISSGLDHPRDLAVDDKGNIFIAEWGKSHQIKVFNDHGHLSRTIGKQGGPRTGLYDPQRMAFPYGLSIDSEGKLWVASRRWWVPKVIYVWDREGNHVRNHYGPTQYGGGGNFDPSDPTRFLYHDGKGGVEFRVDWDKGTAHPHAIYHLPFGPVNDRWDQRAELFNFRGSSPCLPYQTHGHRYICNGFASPTTATSIMMLLSDKAAGDAPVLCMLGKVGVYEKQIRELGLWDQFKFESIGHPGMRFGAIHKTLFLWTDTNRDQWPQAEEFTFHQPTELIESTPLPNGAHYGQGAGIINSVQLGNDLEVLIGYNAGREQPGGILRIKPDIVEADGMPIYDLTKAEIVATDNSYQHNVENHVVACDHDRLLLTGGPIQSFVNGKLDWSYHSQWPSLHRGHASPRAPEYPGQLLASTRVIGRPFEALKGESGELWAINGNYGVSYLFTADGLFVDTLFEYRSTGGKLWNYKEHSRGMDVTDTCYLDETFYPTITQFPDGRVVMVVGKSHNSVVELHGLESVRRIEAPAIRISEVDQERIRQYAFDLADWERSQQEAQLVYVRKATTPPAIDGDFSDWELPAWVTVRQERLEAGFSGRDIDYAVAATARDKTNLYIAFRSQGRHILSNEGGGITHLFKNGGGLDIHLASTDGARGRAKATTGDVRLLITNTRNGILAARYRPHVPNAAEPVLYDSPVSKTQIDAVEDVTDQIQVAIKPVMLKEHGRPLPHEQIEVAIPLSTLGWDPDSLPITIGDIGVLVGDQGITSQRIYWSNKATGLVSDIPSEARLEPSQWGVWAVEK